jgi:hypothetical protein
MAINTEYFLRDGETREQYMARTGLLNRQDAAKSAGAAGVSLNDTATLFGATPEEDKAKKDELAKTFGYDSFDGFVSEAFSKPSQTTQQFYQDAYRTAGLDERLSRITKLKKDLSQAEFAINDNPWLSEASRGGRVRRLQELANADITTDEDAYNLGLDQVKNLVAAHAEDIGADERLRESRFNYLTKTAEEAASRLGTDRLRSNLSTYLEGKRSAEKPDTISVGEGSAVYRWNPATASFESVVTRPKTYAPKGKGSDDDDDDDDDDKTVTAFRKSLAYRPALDRAASREQFTRELQSQYPEIDPSDISRAVYETYPDGYDGL